MIKFIRKLIGKYTRPGFIYKCREGDCWVRVHGIPSSDPFKRVDFFGMDLLIEKNVMDYSHKFQYQQVERGRFGEWKRLQSWIGLNNPILKGEEK